MGAVDMDKYLTSGESGSNSTMGLSVAGEGAGHPDQTLGEGQDLVKVTQPELKTDHGKQDVYSSNMTRGPLNWNQCTEGVGINFKYGIGGRVSAKC